MVTMSTEPDIPTQQDSTPQTELLPAPSTKPQTPVQSAAVLTPKARECFPQAFEHFEQMIAGLYAATRKPPEFSRIEEQIQQASRETNRAALQECMTEVAKQEQRAKQVIDADGVEHRTLEPNHDRGLQSIYGDVRVVRLAYRQPDTLSLHPTDGILNLPVQKASHSLARIAAVEASRGSFDEALLSVRERTGVTLGKRQLQTLTQHSAIDFDAFYREKTRELDRVHSDRDVLVLSVNGKGVVMRAEALRPATKQAVERACLTAKTPVPKGEKANRKRMVEVGAVYQITPCPRSPADLLAPAGQKTTPAPTAKNKWLTASLVDDTATVIGQVFDEACRRDPEHQQTCLALAGNVCQIKQITSQAKERGMDVTILIDIIGVIEYLNSAGKCFFTDDQQAVTDWVKEKVLAILEGKATLVAAAIRRKATRRGLSSKERADADRAASYLQNKAEHLDYPTALTNGWPIATGNIQGACEHLVNDRMGITGARWGLDGAEAILKIRALRTNGDFDAYWDFHLVQERRRNHESRYLHGVVPEAA
jgi:hypothetical protein